GWRGVLPVSRRVDPQVSAAEYLCRDDPRRGLPSGEVHADDWRHRRAAFRLALVTVMAGCHCHLFQSPLIPAQARIQFLEKFWMPAFAGISGNKPSRVSHEIFAVSLLSLTACG